MGTGKKIFGHLLFISTHILYGMELETTRKPSEETRLVATQHHLVPVHRIHDIYTALAAHLNSSAEPGQKIALFDLDLTVGVLDDLRLHPSIFDFNVELVRRLQPTTAEWDPFSIVMTDLRKLYKDAQMRPLEPTNGLSKIIQLLQSRNVPCVGLTARSTPLIDATTEHMARDLHINFTNLSTLSETPVTLIDFKKNPPAKAYDCGVCCCGVNSKGIIARELFHALGINPTTLIVLDDSRRNLETFFTEHPFRKVLALHVQIPNQPDLEHFKDVLHEAGLTLEDTIDIRGTRYPRWQVYPSALRLALEGPTGGSEADLRDLASPMSPGQEGTSPTSCRGRFEGKEYFSRQSPPDLKNPPKKS